MAPTNINVGLLRVENWTFVLSMSLRKRMKIGAHPCPDRAVSAYRTARIMTCICCDLCQSWLHTQCIGMTSETLSVYSSDVLQLQFYCKRCATHEDGRYVKCTTLAAKFLFMQHITYNINMCRFLWL